MASSTPSEPTARNCQPSSARRAAERAVGDEQAGGLAGGTGRAQDPVQCGDEDRRGAVAGDAEGVGQVLRADEQHVDAVERGDRLDRFDRGPGLDLHDPYHLGFGAGDGVAVQAEPAHPVVRGHPAVAVGRVAQVPDGVRRVGRAVDAGKHHAHGAEVEQPAGADAGGRLGPHQGGDTVRRSGRDDAEDLLLPAGAVLEVEQHPVDAAGRTDLRGDRGGGAEERAEGRLAAAQPGLEPGAVDRVGGCAHPNHRWVCRPAS